ncbi:hypothetical protein EAD89_26255, partial [Micromonospora sp. BL4]
MRPRRLPRSWLAGRLRSAAGAVQRLAGRLEPVGAAGQRPSDVGAAAPRRFGEPPQHWLDLVAAHAPGLLEDLDLDGSPAGSASTGPLGNGTDGRTGREDAARGAGGGVIGAAEGSGGHRFTADPAGGFGGSEGWRATGGSRLFEGASSAVGGLGDARRGPGGPSG